MHCCPPRHTADAQTSNYPILGFIRIANRFDIQHRQFRWAIKDECSLTHDQILTIGLEAPILDGHLTLQLQPFALITRLQLTRQPAIEAKGL